MKIILSEAERKLATKRIRRLEAFERWWPICRILILCLGLGLLGLVVYSWSTAERLFRFECAGLLPDDKGLSPVAVRGYAERVSLFKALSVFLMVVSFLVGTLGLNLLIRVIGNWNLSTSHSLDAKLLRAHLGNLDAEQDGAEAPNHRCGGPPNARH